MKSKLKHGAFMIVFLLIGALYGYFDDKTDKVYTLVTFVDAKIPFIKWFIVPYYIWYVFIGIAIIYLLKDSTKEYYRYLICLCIGELICFCIYSNFQTTVSRPMVTGNDIFSNLVRNIYYVDKPYNCFPSIHVFTSALTMICMWRNKDLSVWKKVLVQIVGISIILSTLFVKQHVILDAIAGIILAIGLFNFINIIEEVTVKLWKKKLYLSLMTKKKYEI